MTRFARAYGSKAFKGRTEEQATPWFLMRQQLEKSKFRQQIEEKNSSESGNETNSNETLNKVHDTVNCNDTKWEDFGIQNVQKDVENHVIPVKTSSKMDLENKEVDKKSNKHIIPVKCKEEPTSSTNCKGRKYLKTCGNTFIVQSKKPKIEHNNKYEEQTTKTSLNEILKTRKEDGYSLNPGSVDNTKTKVDVCKTKGQKRKRTHENSDEEKPFIKKNSIKSHKESSEFTISNYDCKTEIDVLQMKNKKKQKRNNDNDFQTKDSFEGKVTHVKERSEETKLTDNITLNARKDKNKTKVNANNEQLHYKHSFSSNNSNIKKEGGGGFGLSKFQGVFIKKEDADRLHKLQNDLRAKGVPRKTVMNVLQSERRKAEKKLTREKKVICFNCREFGHGMADCPEAGGPNDICFKCGSTEHTWRTCKVVKGDSFKFSRCFICNEEGHISRQCPDNPRGLYPKGGGCRVCGDVTHLKSDCPTLIEEKEKSTITVGTLNSSTLEELDDEFVNFKKVDRIKKNTVIKF